MPLYEDICRDFKFSKKADIAGAELLASKIGDRGQQALEAFKQDIPRRVLLCGGSEGLADELSSLVYEGFVVAADGATSTILEAGMEADMIVTDLDGMVEDQIEQNAKGATAFIHAHGDNQKAIKRYAGLFTGPVVGTCQCPPPPSLINFGGFTDGDRAACICAELGVSEILLAGFDFENPRQKQGRDTEVKRRKLAWARRIMDMVAREGVRIIPACEPKK